MKQFEEPVVTSYTSEELTHETAFTVPSSWIDG